VSLRANVVVDTLRFLAQGWIASEEDREWCLDAADQIEGYDFEEGGWVCPLCQEVVCDAGCPLESLREV